MSQSESDTPRKKQKISEDSSKNETKTTFSFSESPTLEQIRQLQAEFVNERNWDQYHSPRNILLAMVGEVGEVAEHFQWKGEVKEGLPDWSEEEKQGVANELSDVFIYLVRLSEKCHVDLPAAVLHKMQLNRDKYPVSQAYGSIKKYTEYKRTADHKECNSKQGENEDCNDKHCNGKIEEKS